MAGGADTGDDEIISAINITPLVDVVLVLLIILMVTAKQLVQQESIQMDLPEAASGDPTEDVPTEMRISIEADGTIYVNVTSGQEQTVPQTEVSRAELQGHAERAHAADSEARAIISADTAVPHGDVIAVVDILRTAEVNKFAFSTRRPSELPSATEAPATE